MDKGLPSPGPGQVENRPDLGLEGSGKGGFTGGFCPLEACFLSVGFGVCPLVKPGNLSIYDPGGVRHVLGKAEAAAAGISPTRGVRTGDQKSGLLNTRTGCAPEQLGSY
jgi:hypothetical protein